MKNETFASCFLLLAGLAGKQAGLMTMAVKFIANDTYTHSQCATPPSFLTPSHATHS